MKIYLAMITQFIIWSGYTFIEWLSIHDQLVYKVIMLFIFYYLAFLLGIKIMKSSAKSLFITSLSLIMYSSFHYTMAHFLPH